MLEMRFLFLSDKKRILGCFFGKNNKKKQNRLKKTRNQFKNVSLSFFSIIFYSDVQIQRRYHQSIPLEILQRLSVVSLTIVDRTSRERSEYVVLGRKFNVDL